MIKPQSSRFIVPRWLKWSILITGTILFLCSAFFIYMYADINQDRTKGNDEAAKFALQETALKKVDQVSNYHGDKTVHIVRGVTDQQKNGIVYIDLEKKEILKESFREDNLSLDEMKQEWMNACENCEFKNIQFAYEESHPVFEITYIDEKNRYVLDYYQLNGEKFDQRFAFKQTDS
ncbi:DUF5590 domain-containing protein [Halobacillus yeomjeoni]|uniref:cell wall elongation regulator TseB-like domain-containing protein n=1 Tax=Halobacillus yeomjeoni TaxID=311194 RepID=UPI001CD4CB48|nr:DUF5590 domain-containing protein [Halobacillus yeomjeoni]MCA0983051.1 DUF5590 domain-containing protein [Halobacillus yeomjeoni]